MQRRGSLLGLAVLTCFIAYTSTPAEAADLVTQTLGGTTVVTTADVTGTIDYRPLAGSCSGIIRVGAQSVTLAVVGPRSWKPLVSHVGKVTFAITVVQTSKFVCAAAEIRYLK